MRLWAVLGKWEGRSKITSIKKARRKWKVVDNVSITATWFVFVLMGVLDLFVFGVPLLIEHVGQTTALRYLCLQPLKSITLWDLDRKNTIGKRMLLSPIMDQADQFFFSWRLPNTYCFLLPWSSPYPNYFTIQSNLLAAAASTAQKAELHNSQASCCLQT